MLISIVIYKLIFILFFMLDYIAGSCQEAHFSDIELLAYLNNNNVYSQ
jgi:hypothetical protein